MPFQLALRACFIGEFRKIVFSAENFTPKTSKMTKFRSRTKNVERTVLFEANEVNQELHSDLDTNAHCKVPKTQREIDFECCGQYPERFPYKALVDDKGAASRKCCKDQLYQAYNQQCCYGDIVRPMSFGVCI